MTEEIEHIKQKMNLFVDLNNRYFAKVFIYIHN